MEHLCKNCAGVYFIWDTVCYWIYESDIELQSSEIIWII